MGVTAFRIAARSNADLVQRHALRHSLGSERQIHDPPEPVQTRLNLRQVSGPKHALAGPGKFDRRHDQRLARREVVHHRAAAHARSIGNLDVGDGPIAPLIEALDRGFQDLPPGCCRTIDILPSLRPRPGRRHSAGRIRHVNFSCGGPTPTKIVGSPCSQVQERDDPNHSAIICRRTAAGVSVCKIHGSEHGKD
jgi:hypothetical protein